MKKNKVFLIYYYIIHLYFKDEYGHDPMNTIFKQIYENADENTRKAMIKSYQTSGGTVL